MPCHYRRLTYVNTGTNALDLANNITSFHFQNSGQYLSENFKIFGDDSCAIIKHDNYNFPFIVIKNSYYSSGIYDGFEVPMGYSEGIWGLCAIDDTAYPNHYVSKVYFNKVPHQLPVKYIPTDEEVTQNSENLISSGAVYNALSSVEDNLQFDPKPTLNSEKLVKSGAVATALNEKADKTNVSASVDALNAEISKKANQLDFTTAVNSLTSELNKKAIQTDVTAAINNLNTEIDKKVDSNNVYLKSEIDGFLTGAFHYKGSVDNFVQLPTTAEVGDVYNVKNVDAENNINAGDNVVWCEAEGVGHWDALSGIVDLSAYWTSEEVQTKLNTVSTENQNKLDELDEQLNTKVDQASLSSVALSNDYLDLDNKPCYSIGFNQTITGDYSYTSGTYYSYSVYVYTKRAEYDNSQTLESYINSFKTISHGSVNAGFTLYDKEAASITVEPNGIAVIKISTITSPLTLIVPEAGLSYNLMDKKLITFSEAGIYCLVNTTNSSNNNKTHVNELVFEESFKTLDVNLLPEHEHQITDIPGLSEELNNKVTINPNGRLITTSEITKLNNLTKRYDQLENVPCLHTGVEGIFTWSKQTSIRDESITVYDTFVYKLGDIYNNYVDLIDYQNSFKYLYATTGGKNATFSLSDLELKYSINNQIIVYFGTLQPGNVRYHFNLCIVIQPGEFSYSNPGDRPATRTFTSPGIYWEVNSSTIIAQAELKFEDHYITLEPGYLPTATTETLGAVKVGENLSISEDGTISATSLDWDNVDGKPELYTKSEVNIIKSNLESSIATIKLGLETHIEKKQDISNLVASIGENSTDEQYPSAKLLYTTTQQINTAIQNISGVVGVERGGTGYSSVVDTIYTNARYRASSLHSTKTTPSDNGVIAWQYE